MKILTKITFFLLVFSIIPLAVGGFLVIFTYQEIFKQYAPRPEIYQQAVVAQQNAIIQNVLALAGIVILILFAGVIISRNLTRPIKKLLKGTREITKGNLDFKLDINSKDEFEELGTAFNQMADGLKGYEEKVSGYSKELERKVEERTQDLEKIKLSLENKNKELEGKMKEIETMNKLMVGRELKMMELKKENSELVEKIKNLEKN